MKVIFCSQLFGQWEHIRVLENVPIPRIGEFVNIRGAYPERTYRTFYGRVTDVCYDYENDLVEVMIDG